MLEIADILRWDAVMLECPNKEMSLSKYDYLKKM